MKLKTGQKKMKKKKKSRVEERLKMKSLRKKGGEMEK